MTLHYKFPTIRNISDVLPHIDDNFRVVEKGGLTFINYKMMGHDTFPVVADDADLRSAIRRECRGIVFDTASGALVSRPFHKFFNAGEREDVALNLIDVSRDHHVVDKVDGSMIRPLPTEAGIRWGTKMGITDVAMLAETWVSDKPGYIKFAKRAIEANVTPLFEFCSRKSRVVVDHPEDRLVLVAVRENFSGEYQSRNRIISIARYYGMECVFAEDTDVLDLGLETFLQDLRARDDGEGVVITFSDGHMVKAKCDWYVRLHRTKDALRSERRVAELILNEGLDDLIPILEGEDRVRVQNYADDFLMEMVDAEQYVKTEYAYVRRNFETKKDFALSSYAKNALNGFRSVIFTLWDGRVSDINDFIKQRLIVSLSNEAKFQETKSVFGISVKWDGEEDGDEA